MYEDCLFKFYNLIRRITKQSHMSHLAVVLRFYFTIHMKVGAWIFCDIFFSGLDMLAEDIEHDGWGMQGDCWKWCSQNTQNMCVKLGEVASFD